MVSPCERPIVAAAMAMMILASLHAGIKPAVAGCPAASPASIQARDEPTGMLIDTDMGRPVVYLLNVSTDTLVTVDLSNDPLYPGGMPLHTLILPGARKAYLTTSSDAEHPAAIVVLKIGAIDWGAGCAEITISRVLTIEAPGSASSFSVPAAGSVRQPVVRSMWAPGNQQLHGPTLHPSGKYAYFTQWTDKQVRIVDTGTGELIAGMEQGAYTRQMHGVFFNSAGTIGIGTGYYFDLHAVTLFQVSRSTGRLTVDKQVPLIAAGDQKQYGAFTHFVAWLDDRYALTGTQQTGPTSLTPAGFDVAGPGVWLIDAKTGKATMLIGSTNSPAGHGIYKPASDVAVVHGKLYVAEEDSMDEEVNPDGYVSVWRLNGLKPPTFLKRLGPGGRDGLPADFSLGHALYPTRDGEFIYVQSWASGHLAKIRTATDTVVKVFDKHNSGFVLPHGGFIMGSYR